MNIVSLLPLLSQLVIKKSPPSSIFYIPVAIHYLFSCNRNNTFVPRWQLLPTYLAYLIKASFNSNYISILFGLIGAACDTIISLPAISHIKGQYSVSHLDYEQLNTLSGYPAIGRIFYPSNTTHTIHSNYLFQQNRHGLTSRFIETSGIWEYFPQIPSWILGHWSEIQIPSSMGSQPLRNSNDVSSPSQLPVIVFSHGNTASREISTSMALSLVSSGKAVVVLVEHTDGSSSLARYNDGTSLEFDHSVSALGSKEETPAFLQARRQQSKIRSLNISDAINILDQMNAGHPDIHQSILNCNVETIQQFKGLLKLNNIGLGGHSFGGATVLNYASDYMNQRIQGNASKVSIGGLFVMDPANAWVPDEARLDVGLGTNSGFEHYWKMADISGDTPKLVTAMPVMFMYSESWHKVDKWSKFGKDLITSSTYPNSEYVVVKGAGHQCLCDVAVLLPHVLNEKLLKNTLKGTQSKDLPPIVNQVTLNWLRNVKVLNGENRDIADVFGVMGNIQPNVKRKTKSHL